MLKLNYTCHLFISPNYVTCVQEYSGAVVYGFVKYYNTHATIILPDNLEANTICLGEHYHTRNITTIVIIKAEEGRLRMIHQEV